MQVGIISMGSGGKEEQDDDVAGNSLEWLDFGARNYDAALGRWMNIDPLAEKYYEYSTYNYTANNPLFENSRFQTFYAPEVNKLFFDPTIGTTAKETKGFLSWITGNGYKDEEGILSPAELLLHEFGHAKSYLEDPKQHIDDTKQPLGVYDNKEEYDVIRNIENPAAEKLGHVQRNNHRGDPIRVLSPTSTTPKKKKKK